MYKRQPEPIVQILSRALAKALEDPALRARLETDGMTPQTLSPAQYTALVRSDTERWGQLTRSLQLKAQ